MLSPDNAWPRVGLGCASLGSPSLSDREAETVIERAVHCGIRFFDVAPLYGGGLAEARLGRVLRQLPRDEFILCTKTGVTRPFGQPPIPPGGTRRREADVWDYSPRATRASVARSLERLQIDRLDVVHLHDVEEHLEQCLQAYHALIELRAQGLLSAIGIGSNFVAPVRELIDRETFDAFLLAGCYTLLEQNGAGLLDQARARGIRAVVGGVFNSGILAAWPQDRPTFGYRAADASMMRRTGQIAAVCERHGVPIAAAALQFVQAHPSVATMLLGPASVDELDANLAALRHPIPDALWQELAAASLIAAECPTPRAPHHAPQAIAHDGARIGSR
jgi:D-threo-aldose 1-dehydrogenase